MERIKTSMQLRERIMKLEEARLEQEYHLTSQWETVKDSFKPMNILKRTVGNLISNGKSSPTLIGSIVGLGFGILARRLVVGQSPNFFRKLAGTAIQAGLSGFMAKKASEDKPSFFKKLFTKKKKPGLLPG